MGRKRAKQKRKDYRRGGNVTLPRQGGKRPEDEIISIGGPGGGNPDPRDIGRPVQPPVGKQPMPPVTQPASTVPLSSGPGFVTGTSAANRAGYTQASNMGRGGGRARTQDFDYDERGRGYDERNGGERNGGGGNQGGGNQGGGNQGAKGQDGDGPQPPPNGQEFMTINGMIFRWNGYTYVPTGQSSGGGNDDGGGNTIPTDPLEVATEAQNKATFERERRIRNVREGRTAQEISSGNIPEGTVPVPTVMGIGREGTEASREDGTLIQAPDAGQAQTFTTDQTPAEEVSRVDDVATIDPAREVTTTTTPTETIEQAAQARAAQQDREEIRLAEAAEVADVTLVDEVDVEVRPGSVAEAVTGTLSPGAKARIVENTGTNLARVTRAKKQLANAGVSEEAIQELGKDPEALENRLTDFSEEERGIIEGLPEEALVSNQLESLLTGIDEGEIPTWARPAVATVEAMLAKRGLQASSIARDALANTIIQASLPLAQANAQAIQASVSQQRNIEAAVSEANAQRQQQTVLKNAENVFKMDTANMAAEQQTELANSKFFQTVSLTDATMEQQSAVQNAANIARADLAEADFYQKAQIDNAKNFLATDMANLNNRQQANVIKAQYEQQRLLSNQSAINAMGQFNATNDRQAQQFMAQIETQIRQYNAGYINATNQFNVQAENAATARDAQRVTDVNRANAAIMNQVEQFNEQLNYNRQQWNAANEQAVINSNIDWRRRANTADTAAQNAVNQQNAQNAFGLTQAAQSFLWQELRDQADYDFRWATDTANRKVQAMMSAASAEGDASKNWSANFSSASSTIDRLFGSS